MNIKRPEHTRGTAFEKGKYAAYISLYGKRTCLGRFDTQAEARAAYVAKKGEIKEMMDRVWGRA